MNEDNLISLADRPQRERNEIARKGAIASNAAQRRKKDMASLATSMLDQELTGKPKARIDSLFPDLEEDATMTAQVLAGQINAAAKGNTRAARWLQELTEKQEAREAHEVVYRMDPLDLTTDCIAPYRTLHAFFDGSLALDDMVFKGGRGGAKSSFAAQLAYETMEQDDNANVVYGRRYATDLRHTVFTAFTRLLNEKGVMDEWEVTKSPMRCTRRSSGTAVYFFGFDNAEQLKSFVPERGYVKLLIFEEADEMLGDEQMDSAADTFLRSNGYEGARQLRLKVFNPPVSRNNFMNEWVAEHTGDERVAVFDFSYLNVPEEWLGQVFMDRAARAKRERPDWYRNNYLGEVTGAGGELFSNVEEQTIPEERIAELEQAGLARQGLDFGYEHPMVYIKSAWDPETDTVWVLQEHYERRAKLETFLKNVMEEAPKDQYGIRWNPMRQEVICDSAEPDRIADMLEMDWDAVKAVKRWGQGKGRDYSWEWLRNRARIIVDPSRCPNVAKELRTLEFERLKDGSYASRYPTLDEDGVMALIYSLNREIRTEE